MQTLDRHFIDGTWVAAAGGARLWDAVDPATEEVVARITLGTEAEVDRAVQAARRAFPAYAAMTTSQRLDLLKAVVEAYKKRADDLTAAVSLEMGAPRGFAAAAHTPGGLAHLAEAIRVLSEGSFEERLGKTLVVREPIGVVGMITPWNWPINQVMCKVVPALAVGCTMVLKPSEFASLSARILAEILADAGVPAGVFNLVYGDGPTVGQALSLHPDIDMVSFTGSTRAGILVAKAAADSVKRVHQELGGKSPNIILDDADLKKAVTGGTRGVFMNSGQSCNAPTRMLVPEARHDEACEIAAGVAAKTVVGDPRAEGTGMGPVVNKAQFDKIQGLIEAGITEGARLAAGGPGRPEGTNRGWFVRPTVFGGVRNDMTIAREEIFGPVLAILPYRTEEEAIAIANDTPYGLSAYVQSGDPERAQRVARQIKAGMVHLNGANVDFAAPFGGYKQSGNGREWGRHGMLEFTELKALLGAA